MLLFWLFPLRYMLAYIHVSMFLPLHVIPIDKSIYSTPSCAFVCTIFPLCHFFRLDFLWHFCLSVTCQFLRVHFECARNTKDRRFLFSLGLFHSFRFIVRCHCCSSESERVRKISSANGLQMYRKSMFFQFACAFTICRFIDAAVAVTATATAVCLFLYDFCWIFM